MAERLIEMGKILVSHPTGNANVRAVVEGLNNQQLLSRFQTTIALFPHTFLDFCARGPFKEFRRRSYPEKLSNFTHTWPWYEIGRLLSSKMKWQKLTTHESGVFCVDNVYQTLDKHLAKKIKKQNNECGVYAYEDGAMNSFRAAKAKKMICLYDLPIGYWKTMRGLLLGERERRPEWASTLTGFKDSGKKLARKDEELRLADHIFVASSFTRKTLEDFSDILAPVSVIPYGFPPVFEDRLYLPLENRKLKLLFVGGLSQRKGIANLFEAIENLSHNVELTIVGHKSVDDCQALNEALQKYHWIPSLPHKEVLEVMREHDVLVFPSLFEGFGLVITEAMSQGTPVITTERTAGPDLIEHGENGWLVKAGDTEALRSMIESLIANPEQIGKVGKAAMQTARQRPWQVYGEELATKIQHLLVNDDPS